MRYLYAIILFSFAVLAFFYSTRVIYNKNYKKKTFVLFSLTALSSGIWSSGYAAMLIVTDKSLFLFVRALGIVGLFGFLIFAQCILSAIAEYSNKVFALIGVEALAGIIVCFLAIRPGSVSLIDTPNGIVTVFTSSVISIVYTAYTLIVAMVFIAGSIHMVGPGYMTNVRHFGRNLLIVEGLIVFGMIIDTILPAMGKNLNIPASTMMQFIGLDIVYHAIHKVDRNVINVQNLAEYAYSSLKTPIMVFDINNRMTIINKEARRVFGLSDDDVNRVDFLEESFGLDTLFAETGEYNTAEFEAKYLHGDMYCHLYADPIKNEFGDYIGYIVMVSDVTKEYLYTQELENAKNEANRANKAKSQFLANMSHEIRTPMNSILGFSELCLKDEISDATRGYVTDIRDSAEILLTIINDILDISKIESGKMELVEGEYSPTLVFTEISRVIQMQASKKDLYFRYNIDDDYPNRLYGDKTKIRAVLINILNNGIKYTEKGGVSLNISFENNGNNTGKAKFVIKDTGVGIRKEDIDTIFDVFQRADLSANSSTEGTGLGLSITKGFVELMNGTIEIESEYGSGTTFTICLDQKIIELEKPKRIENGKQVGADKKLRLRNTHVLAVDDTTLNLKLINAIMSRYGAEITTAKSGEEAIEYCKNNLYDLVFMDQMMPVMDGVTAMRHIRELGNGYEAGGKRKIIALTANVIDGARDERIQEGFDDFLGKPINTEFLEIVLTRYLSENHYYFE